MRELHRLNEYYWHVLCQPGKPPSLHVCFYAGHDFRPDYLALRKIRQTFPDIPIMALTATANKRLLEDAISLLGMHDPYVHVQSFNRANLIYDVRHKSKDTLQEIADYMLQRPNQSGIVYCLSRKDTENVASKLRELTDMPVEHYHGDMRPEDRESVQRAWSLGKIPVIAATVAFGMGASP